MRAVRSSRSRSIAYAILTILLFSNNCSATATIPTTDAVVFDSDLTRRADSPPTGTPEESGFSEGDDSDESDFVQINYQNYVQQGGLVATYLRASDADITADLVSKGKLQSGEQLASHFTDVTAFRSNGWDEIDDTPRLAEIFEEYVPFRSALRSLSVSDDARPKGKNERTMYQHTIPWYAAGRKIQPVGKRAAFDFVNNPQDECLIITLAYSTQYWIEKQHLHQHGIVSPPLSHESDMLFLDWKRACAKQHADPKSLKHIFISTIQASETQQVVEHIFHDHGKTLTSWNEVPLWEQKLTFEPNTDEGKALLATTQVKSIMWMLVQHRESLGRKAIKQISVFKDELTGIDDDHDARYRGPSLYLELEDVQ